MDPEKVTPRLPGTARPIFRLILLCLALAGVPALAEKPVATLPMEQVTNADGTAFLVSVDVAGHKGLRFLVDTAAAVTVITPDVRASLGPLARTVGEDAINGAGGAIRVQTVLLPDLRLGRYTRRNVDVVVMDLANAKRWIGKPIDGILGANLLRRFDVQIDAPGRRLRLFAPDGAALPSDDASFVRVPTRTTPSGFVHLPVRVNGAVLSGVLDSGANRHILNGRAAEALGLSGKGVSQDATGADGRVFHATGQKMEAITAGGVALGSREASVGDLPVFAQMGMDLRPAIIVGADALRDRVTFISYDGGAVYLQRTTNPAVPEPVASQSLSRKPA